MFRYIKAAFWAAPEVAGLGRFPANAIALLGMGILGFGHAGFWLLGLGLETAYLYGLTASRRFRRLVDAQEMHQTEESAAVQRQALVAKLAAPAAARLASLEDKCARISQLDRESQTEDFIADGNREALDKLAWLYLKLLVARANLESADRARDEAELDRKIAALRGEIGGGRFSASLLESKQATLRLLEQRRENLDRRDQTLEEIDSDLTRIETQIDLALDNAGMQGKNGAVSANIDLVSQLLDHSVYGDSSASIARLDRAYEKEGAP